MKFEPLHRWCLAIIGALVLSLADGRSLQAAPHFLDPVQPSASTTAPDRIRDTYWNSQFERVNKEVAEAKGSEVVFFGDSITLNWSLDAADGKTQWDKHFAKYRPINMGNSGDITPVMLYRVMQGNLDFAEGQAPRVAVLLCGTNNYGVTQSDGGKVKWDLGIETSPREVADGVRAIAQAFRRKLPNTRVIILGILPVRDPKKWEKCQETNRILGSYRYPEDSVVFIDLEKRFVDSKGSIKPELFKDGTHLTSEGYTVLADALAPHIDRLVAMPVPTPGAAAKKESPGEALEVGGHKAFVILPHEKDRNPHRPTPWVWYAPTLPKLPAAEETWMFERFLENGIAIAGVDVGESYGSPAGRQGFTALYHELTEKRGFSRKPCLLARSRGGLMLYNWAAENPECVAAIAGIYPVGNLRSWPGLAKASGAYGMTAAELEASLPDHNPLDRLAPLAKAGVPIFHIHGNTDNVVPLAENSEAIATRYRELGGSMRLRVAPGQGHNMWQGFFQSQDLVDFVIAHASPAAEREPSARLFRDPPLEARPGAFWDWLNGNVNIPRLTQELEEMKAKGMSGAEIWDIGILRPNPDAPVPAGPPFLGPEGIKAVNHAIDEADRLGLHLGMVASSSWNAGGSWIEPKDAMKGLFHSEITVSGPSHISQLLPVPQKPEAKNYGNEDPPSYTRKIAVLAFPKTQNQVIPDTRTIVDLTGRTDNEGRLTWDVPAGEWVIQHFMMANTGQRLMVPSPNSSGLMLDHLDAKAAEKHFQYIMDQILKSRPSPDAIRYMEVDSVEVHDHTDWTDRFVQEFRQRRGYDPIPYLPVLNGKTFSDPNIAPRFLHDYRMTVSDLWIDGHYRAGTKFLNRYGIQLVAESGHGGYPRTDPLRSMGVVNIPRGEFWNGSQFWVMKEAASAAHIYGQQIVDSEAFTGWRQWQDGPLEYKRLADTAFCDGMNRITFHTFAHTPPEGGVPGLMYHAGEHFNLNTTWWNQSAPMLSYFSRSCYLLQQGLPVADVCFYYGNDAPNLVATRRIGPDSKRLDGATCAHCGRPNPAPVDALGQGYDYDVIDSQAIEQRLEFKDGRLMLPHGVNYQLIVLPERTDMPLPTLEKLEKLVLDGATLLGPKPSHELTLTNYPQRDEQINTIADRLWGTGDIAPSMDRRHGKGRVISDRNRVREILIEQGVGPDFSYTSADNSADLDYIHRRTAGTDIYFVTNTKMEEAEAECVFRVSSTKAQLWHADTADIQNHQGGEKVPGGVKLKLRLPPAGSVFVVFGSNAEPTLPDVMTAETARIAERMEIKGPWQVSFPPHRGAPPSHVFEKLVSWSEIPEDGIKHFSGTATYQNEIEVPSSLLAQGGRIELDLGLIRNVAEVEVNGQPLGILWKPPFRCDVTAAIRPGKNTLAIKITNLWNNRLTGDQKLPKEKRITRITQAAKFDKLLESGLLGPVEIRAIR